MKSSVPSLLAATGIALLSTSTNAQVATVPRRALRGLEDAGADYQWAEELLESSSMSMTSDISFVVANSETAAGSHHKGEAAKPSGHNTKSGKAKNSVVKRRGLEELTDSSSMSMTSDSSFIVANSETAEGAAAKSSDHSMKSSKATKSGVKRRGLEVAGADFQRAEDLPTSLSMRTTSDISFIVAESETTAGAPHKGEAAKPPVDSTKGVKTKKSKAAKAP